MDLFKKKHISNHVMKIETPFGVAMYYVQGNEKGLLIDTGMGVGDLKTFVDSISTTAYDVVLTHGHCDHAGGAIQFEKVYLNHRDYELEKTHATLEHRIFDVFHAPWGAPDFIQESDFLSQRVSSFTDIDEGDVFELGGVTVSFIALPGHTQGTLVPVIQEDRIAIIGDGLGENTLLHFPESTSIEEYKKSLCHLKTFEDSFDICLRFHGNGISKKKIIDDTIVLCDEVLNYKDAKIPTEMMGYKGYQAREKDHPGYEGNFIYNPNNIEENKND